MHNTSTVQLSRGEGEVTGLRPGPGARPPLQPRPGTVPRTTIRQYYNSRKYNLDLVLCIKYIYCQFIFALLLACLSLQL